MVERVYIIDDDEISAFLTSMMLEADLFARQIETFACAEKALQRLQTMPEEELQEVIFLDLNMPVVSGWEFLDALMVQESRYLGKCHVFILTSSVDIQEKEQAQAYSLVNSFLHKPLTDNNLAEINSIFNRP